MNDTIEVTAWLCKVAHRGFGMGARVSPSVNIMVRRLVLVAAGGMPGSREEPNELALCWPDTFTLFVNRQEIHEWERGLQGSADSPVELKSHDTCLKMYEQYYDAIATYQGLKRMETRFLAAMRKMEVEVMYRPWSHEDEDIGEIDIVFYQRL